MSYIGNSLPANFQSLPAGQRFNGTGSATAFTLASAVANDQSLIISVDGVVQDSNAYSVNGTTLTFTAAPSSGTGNIFVNTISPVGSTVVPPDGSVSTVKLVDGSVTQAKVDGQAINESKLQVSNNPTNGLFLSAQSGNTGGLTWAAASAGTVLQVISTTKSDYQTIQGTTFVDVFSLAITPSATSSKIYMTLSINLNGSERYSAAKMYRDSTQINMGIQVGSNRARVSIAAQSNDGASNDTIVLHNSSTTFLDSPSSTNAVTYKVKCGNTYGSSRYTYVNRAHSIGDDAAYVHIGTSTFTLMEIAG